MEQENELKVVSIRLIDEPPLFSRKKIEHPGDAVEVLGEELQKYDRELFCILNLRTKNKVINMNIVSMGTLDVALVHPREVFKSAILSNAAGIMLIHNHPSGVCQPSECDIQITKRLIECGRLLGIPVIDHIIIGEGQEYYSFRNHELLFQPEDNLGVAADKGSTMMDGYGDKGQKQVSFGRKK